MRLILVASAHSSSSIGRVNCCAISVWGGSPRKYTPLSINDSAWKSVQEMSHSRLSFALVSFVIASVPLLVSPPPAPQRMIAQTTPAIG